MSVIVIFGGTGYTGRNVAREAVARGHTVVAVSRSTPSDPLERSCAGQLSRRCSGIG